MPMQRGHDGLTHISFALANGTVRSVTRSGRKIWFFLTSDYAFGNAVRAVPAGEA